MPKLIKLFFILLLGIALGYTWAFHAYKPLQLQDEINRQRQVIRMLNDGYTKQFSKHFLEAKK